MTNFSKLTLTDESNCTEIKTDQPVLCQRCQYLDAHFQFNVKEGNVLLCRACAGDVQDTLDALRAKYRNNFSSLKH